MPETPVAYDSGTTLTLANGAGTLQITRGANDAIQVLHTDASGNTKTYEGKAAAGQPVTIGSGAKNTINIPDLPTTLGEATLGQGNKINYTHKSRFPFAAPPIPPQAATPGSAAPASPPVSMSAPTPVDMPAPTNLPTIRIVEVDGKPMVKVSDKLNLKGESLKDAVKELTRIGLKEGEHFTTNGDKPGITLTPKGNTYLSEELKFRRDNAPRLAITTSNMGLTELVYQGEKDFSGPAREAAIAELTRKGLKPNDHFITFGEEGIILTRDGQIALATELRNAQPSTEQVLKMSNVIKVGSGKELSYGLAGVSEDQMRAFLKTSGMKPGSDYKTENTSKGLIVTLSPTGQEKFAKIQADAQSTVSDFKQNLQALATRTPAQTTGPITLTAATPEQAQKTGASMEKLGLIPGADFTVEGAKVTVNERATASFTALSTYEPRIRLAGGDSNKSTSDVAHFESNPLDRVQGLQEALSKPGTTKVVSDAQGNKTTQLTLPPEEAKKLVQSLRTIPNRGGIDPAFKEGVDFKVINETTIEIKKLDTALPIQEALQRPGALTTVTDTDGKRASNVKLPPEQSQRFAQSLRDLTNRDGKPLFVEGRDFVVLDDTTVRIKNQAVNALDRVMDAIIEPTPPPPPEKVTNPNEIPALSDELMAKATRQPANASNLKAEFEKSFLATAEALAEGKATELRKTLLDPKTPAETKALIVSEYSALQEKFRTTVSNSVDIQEGLQDFEKAFQDGEATQRRLFREAGIAQPANAPQAAPAPAAASNPAPHALKPGEAGVYHTALSKASPEMKAGLLSFKEFTKVSAMGEYEYSLLQDSVIKQYEAGKKLINAIGPNLTPENAAQLVAAYENPSAKATKGFVGNAEAYAAAFAASAPDMKMRIPSVENYKDALTKPPPEGTSDQKLFQTAQELLAKLEAKGATLETIPDVVRAIESEPFKLSDRVAITLEKGTVITTPEGVTTTITSVDTAKGTMTAETRGKDGTLLNDPTQTLSTKKPVAVLPSGMLAEGNPPKDARAVLFGGKLSPQAITPDVALEIIRRPAPASAVAAPPAPTAAPAAATPAPAATVAPAAPTPPAPPAPTTAAPAATPVEAAKQALAAIDPTKFQKITNTRVSPATDNLIIPVAADKMAGLQATLEKAGIKTYPGQVIGDDGKPIIALRVSSESMKAPQLAEILPAQVNIAQLPQAKLPTPAPAAPAPAAPAISPVEAAKKALAAIDPAKMRSIANNTTSPPSNALVIPVAADKLAALQETLEKAGIKTAPLTIRGDDGKPATSLRIKSESMASPRLAEILPPQVNIAQLPPAAPAPATPAAPARTAPIPPAAVSTQPTQQTAQTRAEGKAEAQKILASLPPDSLGTTQTDKGTRYAVVTDAATMQKLQAALLKAEITTITQTTADGKAALVVREKGTMEYTDILPKKDGIPVMGKPINIPANQPLRSQQAFATAGLYYKNNTAKMALLTSDLPKLNEIVSKLDPVNRPNFRVETKGHASIIHLDNPSDIILFEQVLTKAPGRDNVITIQETLRQYPPKAVRGNNGSITGMVVETFTPAEATMLAQRLSHLSGTEIKANGSKVTIPENGIKLIESIPNVEPPPGYKTPPVLTIPKITPTQVEGVGQVNMLTYDSSVPREQMAGRLSNVLKLKEGVDFILDPKDPRGIAFTEEGVKNFDKARNPAPAEAPGARSGTTGLNTTHGRDGSTTRSRLSETGQGRMGTTSRTQESGSFAPAQESGLGERVWRMEQQEKAEQRARAQAEELKATLELKRAAAPTEQVRPSTPVTEAALADPKYNATVGQPEATTTAKPKATPRPGMSSTSLGMHMYSIHGGYKGLNEGLHKGNTFQTVMGGSQLTVGVGGALSEAMVHRTTASLTKEIGREAAMVRVQQGGWARAGSKFGMAGAGFSLFGAVNRTGNAISMFEQGKYVQGSVHSVTAAGEFFAGTTGAIAAANHLRIPVQFLVGARAVGFASRAAGPAGIAITVAVTAVDIYDAKMDEAEAKKAINATKDKEINAKPDIRDGKFYTGMMANYSKPSAEVEFPSISGYVQTSKAVGLINIELQRQGRKAEMLNANSPDPRKLKSTRDALEAELKTEFAQILKENGWKGSADDIDKIAKAYKERTEKEFNNAWQDGFFVQYLGVGEASVNRRTAAVSRLDVITRTLVAIDGSRPETEGTMEFKDPLTGKTVRGFESAKFAGRPEAGEDPSVKKPLQVISYEAAYDIVQAHHQKAATQNAAGLSAQRIILERSNGAEFAKLTANMDKLNAALKAADLPGWNQFADAVALQRKDLSHLNDKPEIKKYIEDYNAVKALSALPPVLRLADVTKTATEQGSKLLGTKLAKIEASFDRIDAVMKGGKMPGWKEFSKARADLKRAEAALADFPDAQVKEAILTGLRQEMYSKAPKISERSLAKFDNPNYKPGPEEAIALFNDGKEPDEIRPTRDRFIRDDINIQEALLAQHLLLETLASEELSRSQAMLVELEALNAKSLDRRLEEGWKLSEMTQEERDQQLGIALAMKLPPLAANLTPEEIEMEAAKRLSLIDEQVKELKDSPGQLAYVEKEIETRLRRETIEAYLKDEYPQMDAEKRKEIIAEFMTGQTPAERQETLRADKNARAATKLMDESIDHGYMPLEMQKQLGAFMAKDEMEKTYKLKLNPYDTEAERKAFVEKLATVNEARFALPETMEKLGLPKDAIDPKSVTIVMGKDEKGKPAVTGLSFAKKEGDKYVKKTIAYSGEKDAAQITFALIAQQSPEAALKYQLEQSGMNNVTVGKDSVEVTFTKNNTVRFYRDIGGTSDTHAEPDVRQYRLKGEWKDNGQGKGKEFITNGDVEFKTKEGQWQKLERLSPEQLAQMNKDRSSSSLGFNDNKEYGKDATAFTIGADGIKTTQTAANLIEARVREAAEVRQKRQAKQTSEERNYGSQMVEGVQSFPTKSEEKDGALTVSATVKVLSPGVGSQQTAVYVVEKAIDMKTLNSLKTEEEKIRFIESAPITAIRETVNGKPVPGRSVDMTKELENLRKISGKPKLGEELAKFKVTRTDDGRYQADLPGSKTDETSRAYGSQLDAAHVFAALKESGFDIYKNADANRVAPPAPTPPSYPAAQPPQMQDQPSAPQPGQPPIPGTPTPGTGAPGNSKLMASILPSNAPPEPAGFDAGTGQPLMRQKLDLMIIDSETGKTQPLQVTVTGTMNGNGFTATELEVQGNVKKIPPTAVSMGDSKPLLNQLQQQQLLPAMPPAQQQVQEPATPPPAQAPAKPTPLSALPFGLNLAAMEQVMQWKKTDPMAQKLEQTAKATKTTQAPAVGGKGPSNSIT